MAYVCGCIAILNSRLVGMYMDSLLNSNAPPYAQLHCLSNYSFLRGASFPEELVERAAELQYLGLALTDECSVAGVVRAHLAAKQHAVRLIIGSEIKLANHAHLVLLAPNRTAYGELCSLITQARRAAPKGEYLLTAEQFREHAPTSCLILWRSPNEPACCDTEAQFLQSCGLNQLWIGAELPLDGSQSIRRDFLHTLAARTHWPISACEQVLMHTPARQAMLDTLTAIRWNTPITELGYKLSVNSVSHLHTRAHLAKRYPHAWLEASAELAARCHFSLDELRYEYPRELVPEGFTPASWLRHLTEQGMQVRWPSGAPDKVHKQVRHELELICELNYEPYFLTVYDIVRFARAQNILCQGRGSAANSAICYCLGITEVDPGRMELLFERFISRERNEPPDIDVDFEHERREEVIQYIYQRYGRHRAALAATVITYQPRSALRDVGKALSFSLDQVDRLAKAQQWWDGSNVTLGGEFERNNPRIQLLVQRVQELIGFPRHLSQHVGGFVIASDDLSLLVPIENAASADRTLIQWEKRDLEALGLLKIDVLALGMLTAIRKALQLISTYQGKVFTMADVPAEDPQVYRMLQKADTLGLFQIESRAQMSMLPRLKPQNYYDLVIQIAIVRPGPIQGDMVHPYLERRAGRQAVTYPSEDVRVVLQRTLGVPIFQEQVMQLAMVAAGFTAGEADELRRSMSAWKRRGGLEKFEHKLKEGMRARGYSQEFAGQIFRQILGFGEYGFPESHSASFALLAYVSAWLKCYHPAAFTCALLNSQPMGFYAPAQLVQDAQRHGVEVRPVDVRYSEYDCSLEYSFSAGVVRPALRLGLGGVRGLSQIGAQRLVAKRGDKPWCDLAELQQAVQLEARDLECLAAADALSGLVGHRHHAYWEVLGTEKSLPVLGTPRFNEGAPLLTRPTEAANIVADYATVGLSLRRHPVALLRDILSAQRVVTAETLETLRDGATAKVCGLVINRQRPGTASGVVFVTLEDETGHINLIVWAQVAKAQRQPLLQARLLQVEGSVQKQDGVLYVVAKRLKDRSDLLGELLTRSRDFH